MSNVMINVLKIAVNANILTYLYTARFKTILKMSGVKKAAQKFVGCSLNILFLPRKNSPIPIHTEKKTM